MLPLVRALGRWLDATALHPCHYLRFITRLPCGSPNARIATESLPAVPRLTATSSHAAPRCAWHTPGREDPPPQRPDAAAARR